MCEREREGGGFESVSACVASSGRKLWPSTAEDHEDRHSVRICSGFVVKHPPEKPLRHWFKPTGNRYHVASDYTGVWDASPVRSLP